jgi:hypothetical protein
VKSQAKTGLNVELRRSEGTHVEKLAPRVADTNEDLWAGGLGKHGGEDSAEEELVPVLRQDGVFMETGTTSSRSAPSKQALLSTALSMVGGGGT